MKKNMVWGVLYLFLFSGCNSLHNDPALKEWKDFQIRKMNSDAKIGGTWEILKLTEVKHDLMASNFAIYEIQSMQFKKAKEKLDNILDDTSLRSKEISTVISFIKNKYFIDKYKIVLSINEQVHDIARLIANSFSRIENNNSKITIIQQKEFDKLLKQLQLLEIKLFRFNSKWLKLSRTIPNYDHALLLEACPNYYQTSIRAYGSAKFYNEINSYIESGEFVLNEIIKSRISTNHWPSRKIFDNKINFSNWNYSTQNKSFSIWRSVDLLGPNKYILRYIYEPEKKGWYLEFLETNKSAFMKKSATIEKWTASCKNK